MGDGTKIEWTDASWNPLRARNRATGRSGHFCVKVSDECKRCYAERLQGRLGNVGVRYAQQDLRLVELWLDEATLRQPLAWTRPRQIFPCSMTDLFADFYPDKWADQIFAAMALTPHHTYQVLTKRAERMFKYMTRWPDGAARYHHVRFEALQLLNRMAGKTGWTALDPESLRAAAAVKVWPLPNVWMGVSAGTQAAWDERVEFLGKTPAALRWVSAEPLLEDIDVGNAFDDPPDDSQYGKVNWVVVGGESGPGCRTTTIGHIRWMVKQCRLLETPVFVKQLGAKPVNREGVPHGIVHTKGGDPAEWPADLRVRQYPAREIDGRPL